MSISAGSLCFLRCRDNRNLNRVAGIGGGRDAQNDGKIPIRIRPGIRLVGIWVCHSENFNVPIPYGLPVESLMDGRGSLPSRIAATQMAYHYLQAFEVFLFVPHSVQPALPRSTRLLRRQRPAQASCGWTHAFCRSCNTQNSAQPQPQSFPAFC